MEKKRARFSRAERRFAAIGVIALALTLALAFWFSVPLTSEDQTSPAELVPLVQSARVDLNTADAAALCTLPGIGEKMAQRILDYRAQYGPFEQLSDAAKVSGITEAMIEQWQGLAYVS